MYELINDDSIKILDKLLAKYNSNKIVIVTDPPFNIKFHYKTYTDNMNENDYYEMLKMIISKTPSVLIHYPENLVKLSLFANKIPKKIATWVYNSNINKQHRDIYFYDIIPDFKQVRQPYKENSKKTRKMLEKGTGGARIYDWWNINQVKNVSKEKTKHPCQMPLEVMKNIIGILPKDAIIIDPFMGSGTTGEAVLIMNNVQNASRKFVGIEIDKDYFEISKNRICKKEEEIMEEKKIVETEKNEEETRICSECGKEMNSGYMIDNGMEYYCSDECLHEHYTEEEYLELYDDGYGDSCWTEW